MPDGKFVAYYRVSTAKQGQSGHGLAAQQTAVTGYLNGGDWTLLDSFTEIESGKKNDRPELAKALNHCRLTGATLVIAKLDRLSRDAAFLINMESSGVNFVAADMPHANRLTVRLMAVLAQEEREMISRRTKDALAAAKARGVILGGYKGGPAPDGKLGAAKVQEKAAAFAARVAPRVIAMREEGRSLHEIAAALSAQGIVTPQGGEWTATAVRRVMMRVADLGEA